MDNAAFIRVGPHLAEFYLQTPKQNSRSHLVLIVMSRLRIGCGVVPVQWHVVETDLRHDATGSRVVKPGAVDVRVAHAAVVMRLGIHGRDHSADHCYNERHCGDDVAWGLGARG